MSKRDQGNPNAIIQERLQILRAEREQSISDIDSLEQEKASIQKILPKVFHELSQIRESVELKRKEMAMYDNAIGEIEKNYGEFLYSPSFFHASDL